MNRISFSTLLELYKGLNKATKTAIKQRFNETFNYPKASNVFHEKLRVPRTLIMYEYDFLTKEILKNSEFEEWCRNDLQENYFNILKKE